MLYNRLQMPVPHTRRRFLQGMLGGAAGLMAWQGWPRLKMAIAQKAAASGQMTWAIHVTIAPTWFDPGETPGVITPYMFLYAMHDALVKPMPGNPMTPCLATTWRESEDGLTYDFELRQGVKFHNGDPFTAEDVQYSFERYKGGGAGDLKKKVQAVEVVNPHQVRFRLHEPWPDFLTYYATPATGAGWIVPKTYTEKNWQRQVQGTTNRAGAISLCEPSGGCRAGHGSEPGLLAQGATCQTSGLQERPGGHDTPGHAQKA
jgi:ABC-type transport system substrate-binding protein